MTTADNSIRVGEDGLGKVKVPAARLRTSRRLRAIARSVVVGGLLGFVLSLAVLFVFAVADAAAVGLPTGSAVFAGASLMMLLSMPTGFVGVVAGAIAGAGVGGVVAHIHTRHRSPH